MLFKVKYVDEKNIPCSIKIEAVGRTTAADKAAKMRKGTGFVAFPMNSDEEFLKI